jgi:hypothetical protein
MPALERTCEAEASQQEPSKLFAALLRQAGVKISFKIQNFLAGVMNSLNA